MKYGRVVVQMYKRKPLTNFRCAGCKKILLQIREDVTFQLQYPIVCCGKIRVEPVGEGWVNVNSITDMFPWKHKLPEEQK